MDDNSRWYVLCGVTCSSGVCFELSVISLESRQNYFCRLYPYLYKTNPLVGRASLLSQAIQRYSRQIIKEVPEEMNIYTIGQSVCVVSCGEPRWCHPG